MILSAAVLNRTLLARQHLLQRVDTDSLDVIDHLLGLQAQAPLPPYLSLHARVSGFDPQVLSRALEDRQIVRLLLMRGTVHAVSPADATSLRRFSQPVLDRAARTSAVARPAMGVSRPALLDFARQVLADGPLPVGRLGEHLAQRFPDVPAKALVDALRMAAPLVQVPPRGMWQRSGGVVYQLLDTWIAELPEPAPPADIARRYLRAFGPATAADVTAWSGITGAAGILAELGDEIVRYRTESGREVLDLAGLDLADPDIPAPVRLLGQYDNLWLSHAGRDRVTAPEVRPRWMGSNGGVANTVFVDGWLHGLWRRAESGALDVELFGRITRAQRRELDAEVAALERLLT